MKIEKTRASAWRGNGCGHSGASWGVVGRADIRILRECGFWKAYVGARKFVECSRVDLENTLMHEGV